MIAEVPKGHYTETDPIKIYTEHLAKKNFIISASTNPQQPFAKSCGFTQRIPNTRAAQKYEGNINFPRENENRINYRTNVNKFAGKE